MPAPEPAKELNPQLSIEVEQPFPIFLRGTVIKGFGRGSKQLGIPTANLPQDTVDQLCSETQTGIYYGLALVVGVDETPRTMVMSVGWNPFYGNQKRSAEVHVINDYTRDFYGQELKVVVLGYLRPEKNYPSIEELIEAIHGDINDAKNALLRPSQAAFVQHRFFTE